MWDSIYSVNHSAGVGFSGQASILITRYKPLHLFTVVRLINLESLTVEQMEEVQHEMKLSQQFCHRNVACYLANFVVGVHLWAVQPLMHYGGCEGGRGRREGGGRRSSSGLKQDSLLPEFISPSIISGSCADIMHSAQPFRSGFKETLIAIILRDVVQGLQYLHNLGYVHRYVCTHRVAQSSSYEMWYRGCSTWDMRMHTWWRSHHLVVSQASLLWSA